MKYTAEQRITRARMDIINHPKWVATAGVLMYGRSIVDETTPTAKTNGRDVFYGRAFVESLTTPELRFLILHENEHKMSRQITTYAHLWKDNPRLTNGAMDYVVNCRLYDTDAGEGFILMPASGGLFDEKYRGWSTIQVYRDLIKNPPPQEGMDEHDFADAEDMTDAEREEIKVEIEQAIREGIQMAGRMEGSTSRIADYLPSQLPWRQLLAEFMQQNRRGSDNASWRRVNPRYAYQGTYLPGLISEQPGGLLIAGDASGSTWSGDQLAGFLGEVARIIEVAPPEFVDFIWWDTKVQAHWRFTPNDYDTMMDTIKNIQGGGGTAPSCIADWLVQHPADHALAIVLSDGLVGDDWGSWGALPVLWCLNTKGVQAGTGQTIYIED